MPLKKWSVIGLAILVGGALAGTAARAQGIRDLAAQLADKVRADCAGLKQSAVKIGRFTPDADALDFDANGAGFSAELSLALQGFLSDEAELTVSGQIYYVSDPADDRLKVIKVQARLANRNGDVPSDYKTFVGYIRKIEDIAKMAGASVSFKTDKEYEKEFEEKNPGKTPPKPSVPRNEELQKTIPPAGTKPPEAQAHIDGTLVRAKPGSPYAVEIRTLPLADFGKRPAEARKPDLKNGLAFVPINKGELYEVRVLNDSKEEIAVSLAIDGIDQFTFSDDREPITDKKGEPMKGPDGKTLSRPRFNHWIVDAAEDGQPKEIIIRGWHKTVGTPDEPGKPGSGKPGSVLSFLVTEYGKGASALPQFPGTSEGKVGLIAVGISRSRPFDPNATNGDKGGQETGFGPPQEVIQEVVKRTIDPVHEIVTIRYNR